MKRSMRGSRSSVRIQRRLPVLLALLLLASAMLAPHCGGGARSEAPRAVRNVEIVVDPYRDYEHDELLEILAADPEVLLLSTSFALYPIGHPLKSGDCESDPSSEACQVAAFREYAASQGVSTDRLCTSERIDLYVKRRDYEVDVIDGEPFDPDWLLRVPGHEFESDLAAFFEGITYQGNIDREWVEAHEDGCCHDSVPYNCGLRDRCVMRYGRGEDDLEKFWVTALGADVRNPDYQDWVVGRLVGRLEETGTDCLSIGSKPGWWIHHDGSPSGQLCEVPHGRAWVGPTGTRDPCTRWGGGLLTPTPYASGEFEEGVNAIFRGLFDRLDADAHRTGGALVIDVPMSRNAPLWWLDGDITRNPRLVGRYLRVVRPLREPSPSLSVYVYEPSGRPSLEVGLQPLVARIAGSATGSTEVHGWCNCDRSTSDLALALERCGDAPGNHFATTVADDVVEVKLADCDYGEGRVIAKVLAVREGVASEDRLALRIGLPDPRPACDDRVDSDGDGLIDWREDPGCGHPGNPTESPACDNGLDDDGDGAIDASGGRDGNGQPVGPDPGCRGDAWRASEAVEGGGYCGAGGGFAAPLLLLAAGRFGTALARAPRRG